MAVNTSELYPHEKLTRTTGKSTKTVGHIKESNFFRAITPEEQQARLKALESMPDPDDIDYSDIPKITEERLKNAVVVRNPWMRPPTKTTLKQVQIDSDIIFWILRQVGEEGYQDKMNAMLRKAMEDERAAQKKSETSD